MMPPIAEIRAVNSPEQPPASNGLTRELWCDNTSGQVCWVYPLAYDRFYVIYPNGLDLTLSGFFFRQGYSPAEIPVGITAGAQGAA